MQKCLTRIQLNAAPKSPRAKKKAKSEPPQPEAPRAEFPVVLYRRDPAGHLRPVPLEAPNGSAWEEGSLLLLGPSWFEVEVNPPTVVRIYLHPRPMEGCPLLPALSLRSAEEAACQWRWFRRAAGSEDLVQVAGSSGEGEQAPNPEDACYTPGPEDIGCTLVVECTPASRAPSGQLRWGPPVRADTPGHVAAGPGPGTSGSVRQQLALGAGYRAGEDGRLLGREAPGLRVVTYNLLADQYASTTYAQEQLFGYCQPTHLDIEYRKQLLLQELSMYGADLAFLQEVDEKAFREYYQPHLARLGYRGIFTPKAGGKVSEGCGLFFRESRFRLEGRRDIALRDVFRQPLAGPHARFAPLLDANPHLTLALQKVTTIGQLALLRDEAVGGRPLVALNTHLFFHPRASHIRTLHTAALLDEVAAFASQQQQQGGEEPALLFCGDLNSDLNDGLPGPSRRVPPGHVHSRVRPAALPFTPQATCS